MKAKAKVKKIKSMVCNVKSIYKYIIKWLLDSESHLMASVRFTLCL